MMLPRLRLMAFALLLCTPLPGIAQSRPDAPLPPARTRDLAKAAVALPDGLDGFPLGCDPVVNIKDGSLLIRIPAGQFILGSDRWPEEGGEAFSAVLTTDYYIGAHEVTNAQYKRFVDETGHRPPTQHDTDGEPEPIWQENGFPPELADHPVTGVSWEDAAAYCAWAGLRLPLEPEWERAARGTDGRAYPWGNDWDASLCRNATIEWSGTAPVYEFAGGRSPWGLYNMSGNVTEWCHDGYSGGQDYETYKAGNLSPREPGADLNVTRGGDWYTCEFDWMLRTSQRGACAPTERHCHIGFRVAMTP